MNGDKPRRAPRTVAVRVVIALVVLVGATVLFGGGITLLVARNRNDAPRETIDDYFKALIAEDYAKAYDLRCDARQAGTDAAAFEQDYGERFGTVKSYAVLTYRNPGLFGANSDAIVQIKTTGGSGPDAQQSATEEVELVDSDDGWKVCSEKL
jgi:hypothetical protein